VWLGHGGRHLVSMITLIQLSVEHAAYIIAF
jgi:hypothetical protein